jgi:hypothetical protein
MGNVDKVDLQNVLIEHQRTLLAHLDESRAVLYHPGAKGATSEFNWCSVIARFLPKRYEVSSAFVVDADGFAQRSTRRGGL